MLKRNSFLARATMTLLLTMFCCAGMQAKIYTGFTSTAGTPGAGSGEGPEEFVDGNRNSKWCVTHLGNPTYIEFNSAVALTPTGYILTTGNDTQGNSGRNPKSWKLWGKVNKNDATWTELVSVTNDNTLGATNNTPYQFSISGVTTAYQYFRFEVSAVQSGTIFQLSEIELLGYEGSLYDMANVDVTMEEFYLYDGNNHLPLPVLKNAEGTTLVKDTDYELSYSSANDAALGNYTVTVTGKGSYSGSSRVLPYTVSYKPVGLSVDNSFASDATGYYYVNVPLSGTQNITINEHFTTPFKVYDHAGKDNAYACNANGSIVLTAPAGFIIQVTGNYKFGGYSAYNESGDKLTFTENDGSQDVQLKQVTGYNASVQDLGTVSSTMNNMTIKFESNSEGFSDGFNLTVAIYDARDLAAGSIEGLTDYQTWTGSVITPTFTVKNVGGAVLTENTDYTVSYSPATVQDEGTYTLTISAKDGNAAGYTGSKAVTFRVVKNPETIYGYTFGTEGTGDSKVYLINDEYELEQLAAYVNSGHNASGKTFKLNADITMKAEHTAIGNSSNRFCGTFDGNNKTISNLTVNNPSQDYQGLFGFAYNCVIKDVTLTNCHITGKKNVGGIVGYISSQSFGNIAIQNCHVSGTIAATESSAHNHGGIAGLSCKVGITGCTVQGTISTAQSNESYGGIVGYADSNTTITSCENAANITGDGDNHGGILGYSNSDNSFSQCLNRGTVEGANYVGAIAGCYYYQSYYTNCYYATPCNVKGLGSYSGSPSDFDGKAERAYAITAGSHVGGIVTAETASITSTLTSTNYYKAGDWTLTLTPALNNGETLVSYACEGGTLTAQEGGTYKLTISDADVTINAIVSQNNGTDIAGASIIDIAEQRWKNAAIEPALTVTYGQTPLTLGTDYLVEYSNNTAVGTATITLTGINSFKGTTTKTFAIADFPLVDPTNVYSADNPYQIATEADLQALASIVNTGARKNGFYRQTDNITLTEEHTAIGSQENNFKGTFDGNNLTISDLVINKPNKNYQGLFGYIYDAHVKQVNLVNCNITGLNYTGGIVGYKYYGMIDHCTVTGTINGSSQNHGGIAGYSFQGSIQYCFGAATVEEGTSCVGSIVGYNNSTKLTDNYHLAATTGGVGAYNVTTGTDQAGAELAVKIIAGTDVTITYPATPSYEWNSENYYKNGTTVTLAYAVPDGKFFDHYTVSSGTISNAGTSDGEHTLTGFTQDVTITGSYADSQLDLEDGNGAIADIATLTFNGQEQHPLPVVTYGNETLKENENYTISYSEGCTNVDNYTVTVTGTGRYTGTLSKQFAIAPFDISGDDALTIIGIDAQYGQTGSTLHPTPAAVTCATANNATLVAGTDYTLVYSEGCTAPGNYTVTLNGEGNYTGSKIIDFTILEAYGITVHNGATTCQYLPVWGTTCDYYQKNEFVMPAAELSAMSGKAITSMQFYLKQKASEVWKGTFQVFMKEVDATTLSVYSGTDGATIVYEGSLDGSQDVMTVNFTSPYAYQGGNLLVGIYKTTKNNCPYAFFYGEEVTGASISGCNSSTLANVNAAQRNFLPKTTFWYETLVTLADNDSQAAAAEKNSAKIADNAGGEKKVVKLTGRKLYKDGAWNTICLPFDVTLANSPLAGAIAKTLSSAEMSGDNLSLTFSEAVTTLEAGVPYIIMWDKAEGYDTADPATRDITEPVFAGVTIDNSTEAQAKQTISLLNGAVKFIGYYDAFGITADNTDIYYMTADNTLKHTGKARTLMACRAYFQFSDDAQNARQFTLNFGDDETTGIIEMRNEEGEMRNDGTGWYTVDGVKLDKQPTRKGLYIHNGRKTVIK